MRHILHEAKWDVPYLFSGFKGRGADAAWWQTAASHEKCRIDGTTYVGSATDIWKAFDQVQRPIVYMAMLRAGIPASFVLPYAKFMEGLTMYNALGTGVGAPYRRRCSIPQGCPVSMLALGLLTVAWANTSMTFDTKPRGLADDFLLEAQGEQAEDDHRFALEASHDTHRQLGGPGLGAQVLPLLQ